MEAITRLHATTVVLPDQDIDTDQIIPARFLTTTTREGLGRHLFADRRYLAGGEPDPAFPLNQPAFADAKVLVAGSNFGCGSSREHAPWALLDYGLRAVLTSRLADIFRSNALKNGLLAIEVAPALHEQLLAAPGSEVTIDLAQCTVTLAGGDPVSFDIDGFARHCLMEGVDQLGFLLGQDAAITAFEAQRP